MRKLYLALATLTLAGVLAQTLTAPTPVDWRYTFSWDDPNPVGQVARWDVYASNNVGVKVVLTRASSVDIPTLLSGTPGGIYALFVVPTSVLGEVGEVSTNFYVSWPGGTGKLKGGSNLRVNK